MKCQDITSCDHSIPFGIRWIHVIRYVLIKKYERSCTEFYDT